MILKIKKFNETFLHIDTSLDIMMELHDHFSFFVDGYKHMPKFKAGIWSGKVNLYSLHNKLIYVGLFDDVVEFCRVREYQYQLVDSPAFGLPNQETDILPDDVAQYCKELNVQVRGNDIEFRDFQMHAVYLGLKHKRRTILSSTGSGKSLIIYTISRWITANGGRVLIVVPTTTLVHQMLGDFKDYSTKNGWDAEANCYSIMAGNDRQSTSPIVISTWQSLSQERIGSSWMNQFECVILDECHGGKAKEIGGIMEKATNVPYKLGFTGTLDNSKTNQMVIKGLFGPIVRVSSTKALMDDGTLSKIKIKCLVLDYSTETKKLFTGKVDYSKEVNFLVSHDRRNKFIRNLALSLEGNTLILYRLVENHGQLLYDLINTKAGDRSIHFVHGGIDSKDRDDVRQFTEESNNTIVIASEGTFSAGINVRNIQNLILASPTKSVVRLLQSIGRGLRTHESKTHLRLFDISDRLNKSKTKRNHTYGHFIQRLEIYSKEEFDYNIVEVQVE